MKYDTKDGGFKSLGEFLVRVRKACDGDIQDGRLKTAGHMAEGEDSQGGFLVPEQWADGIYHAALEGSIVRARVDKDAIYTLKKGNSVKFRKLHETDRSSNLFGGITFQWMAEAGEKVEAISKPSLGECELVLKKLVGGCFASNELEDDYGAMEKFIRLAFGQAIRFIEDDAFINGTGVGQPLGILNALATIRVPRWAAGAIDWRDIARMTRRLLPDSWERAVWLINSDALHELFEATAPAANQVTVLDLSQNTLWGRPFIVTEKCQSIGTLGDIILADFGAGHYLIADKEMGIWASRHVDYGQGHYGFRTDETFWKVVLRTDGQPLMSQAITPYRGANSLGPFVALTTPTS